MSVGNAVGAVVGAVVGFYVGGPAGALKGAQLGMTVGGIVDPPKGPNVNGPRLTDLTLQTSTYNSVIARVYGTTSVSGNIIWLENNRLKEVATKKKSGGKGGGGGSQVTTYAYYGTFAVALCKGPIIGVKRIWIGANLVYNAGSNDIASIIASNETASLFNIHNGSDTQLPDTRMQATLGASNTPAYRGLAYIVFKDLALAAYGNTLMGAQIKVEVVSSGSAVEYLATTRTMLVNRGWTKVAWNGRVFCTIAYTGNICATSPDGITWTEYTLPRSSSWQFIRAVNGIFVIGGSGNSVCYSRDGISWLESMLPSSGWSLDIAWNGKIYLLTTDGQPFYISSDLSNWISVEPPSRGNYKSIAWNGSVFVTFRQSPEKLILSKDGYSWTEVVLSSTYGFVEVASKGSLFCIISSTNGAFLSHDGISWDQKTAGVPSNNIFIASSNDVFMISNNSQYVYTSPDGIDWTARDVGISEYRYGIAWNGGVFCVISNASNHPLTIQPYYISSTSAMLSTIISEECIKSNLLTSSDIDVTALTQQVRGYRIGRVSALKCALEPLQAAWPFDIIQSGYKLKFKPRGDASVVTIPAEDLAARQGE